MDSVKKVDVGYIICVVDLRAWWLMHQVLYNKDDFFDSLSCDAIEGGRAERTKFSEQRKIDTEVYFMPAWF